MNTSQTSQVAVIGVEIFGRLVLDPIDLGLLQLWGNCTHHTCGHLILQVENVIKPAVKTVCPQMRSGRGVDKLASDTHSATSLPNATFKNISNTEFSPDLLHVH